MAISRRPSPTAEAKSAPVDVDALISKGGSVANASNGVEQPKEEKDVVFTMRLPGNIGAEVDAKRMVPFKVSRQQWIMEAITQRLERERQK